MNLVIICISHTSHCVLTRVPQMLD
jgi:hypothetical protein